MIVFDSHCDTASRILDEGEGLDVNGGQVDLRRLLSYDGAAQFFAAFVDKKEFPHSYVRCTDILKNFIAVASRNTHIEIVTGFEQMTRAVGGGRVAAFLTVEGGEALEGDIGNLRRLYDLGVRCLTLTWNYDNELASGTYGGNGGLTAFGREVVRDMDGMGMIIDLSHISHKAFFEVCEASSKPIIASHSNSYVVCAHPRNITDEQFACIVNKKGMVGINFLPLFLNNTDRAGVSDIIKHIEYFLVLGGENSVGLGADFDGITETPSDVRDAGCYGVLYNELLRLNYSQQLADKIFYKNYFEFIKLRLSH